MKQEYYQDGRNRFLRLPAENVREDAYQIRMIKANQPPFLLRIHEAHEGAASYYDYNISGLVALCDCLPEQIQETYLFGLLYALKQMAGELEDLLLLPDEVLLSPELIFIDPAKERFYFCYYPDYEGTVQKELENLMEFFIKKLTPKNQAEMLLLYGLYQRSREANVTFDSLIEYWRSMNREEKEPAPAASQEVYRGEVEYTEKSGDKEDREIFEELGLEFGNRETVYTEWKEQKKIEARETPPFLLEGEQIRKPEKEEVPVSDSKWKWIRQKVKDYAFEICISIVVGTGVIIMILT